MVGRGFTRRFDNDNTTVLIAFFDRAGNTERRLPAEKVFRRKGMQEQSREYREAAAGGKRSSEEKECKNRAGNTERRLPAEEGLPKKRVFRTEPGIQRGGCRPKRGLFDLMQVTIGQRGDWVRERENYRTRGGRVKKHIVRIPAEVNCRIALASDLHNADGRGALKVMREGRPDLIAVTGDLFMGYLQGEDRSLLKMQKNILRFVRGCVDIAPTYISLGNHEWLATEKDLRALIRAGAVILDNEWTEVSLKASEGREKQVKLVLGGMTSGLLMDYRLFIEQYGKDVPYPHEVRHTNFTQGIPDAGWLDDFEAQEGYKILLCHHPEYWKLQEPMLAERKIDLVLSGHAHGGQIRIFGHGLFAPGQGAFPEYTGGVHWGTYGRMVISRGLSNTAPWPIPRLFNPPEIVFAELGK